MHNSVSRIVNKVMIASFICFIGAAGCTSKQPILRTNEAIPSAVAELDEATDLVSRRHVSNFKLCVQRSNLVDDSDLKKYPMLLVFTINPDGKASHVKIISKNFKGSAFASCVKRILTWIYFPNHEEDPRQVRLQLWLDEDDPLHNHKK